jgi:hypothetical protein
MIHFLTSITSILSTIGITALGIILSNKIFNLGLLIAIPYKKSDYEHKETTALISIPDYKITYKNEKITNIEPKQKTFLENAYTIIRTEHGILAIKHEHPFKIGMIVDIEANIKTNKSYITNCNYRHKIREGMLFGNDIPTSLSRN